MSTEPRAFTVPTHTDERGALGVLEGDNLPFAVKRAYFLYNGNESLPRGAHAHRNLRQVFIAFSGVVTVTLNDGLGHEWNFVIDSPETAIDVPAGYWRDVHLQGSAVCLVLASDRYNESDYIRDFEEFRQWKLSRS